MTDAPAELDTPPFAQEAKGDDGRPIYMVHPRPNHAIFGVLLALVATVFLIATLTHAEEVKKYGAVGGFYAMIGLCGVAGVAGIAAALIAQVIQMEFDPVEGTLLLRTCRVITRPCGFHEELVAFCHILGIETIGPDGPTHLDLSASIQSSTGGRSGYGTHSGVSSSAAQTEVTFDLTMRIIDVAHGVERSVRLGSLKGALHAAHAAVAWEQVLGHTST
jgi:hypothetical protein